MPSKKTKKTGVEEPVSQVAKKPGTRTRKKTVSVVAETGAKRGNGKVNRHTMKPSTMIHASRSWELPTRYGETKAVLLARDPYWIYAYWEITPERLIEARGHLGDEQTKSSTVLRVYQSSGPEGGEPRFLYDVEIRSYITSWYLNVQRPDHVYFIEILQRASSGRLFVLARSNSVTTPRDFATPSMDKKWQVPEALSRYFHKEKKVQQAGVSSPDSVGTSSERFPSGQGL
jgi:hypothetical protein